MDTPDLRSQRGPHVFVTDLERPELADDDRHHLSRALRLRNGDPLTLSDGDGRWRTAVFDETINDLGPVYEIAPPAHELTLAVALTKAAKPEFAVQKATEIGIDHMIVFEAEHSVARWDETKRERNQQRLAVIAREAAMQSRQLRVPTVHVAPTLAAALEHCPSTETAVRADFGGTALTDQHRFVLIGPEGGWSAYERSVLPHAVDLGPSVLRAETAAVVAAAKMVGSQALPT